MESGQYILRADSLEIGFGSGRKRRVLLPPLNASAARGELVAVIGRNGIGKSTLIRTIAGIQKALSGKVLYNEKNLAAYTGNELAGMTSFISTEVVKVSNMNVYDLVSLGRFPHTNWLGSITADDNKLISDAMEKTSVSGFSGRYISELSDGERQKAMIARVLAQDTPVMLMDEPTAFLDVRSKFEILHLLYELTRKEQKTIIFTTHDLDMAIRHADKVWLVLAGGLAEGSPEDLMLSGDFDNLFESSSVKFSSSDGTYSIGNEEMRSIHIEGSGQKVHWTKEALKRAGYTVVSQKTTPFIRVNEKGWEYVSAESLRKLDSIYELIVYMRNSPTLHL